MIIYDICRLSEFQCSWCNCFYSTKYREYHLSTTTNTGHLFFTNSDFWLRLWCLNIFNTKFNSGTPYFPTSSESDSWQRLHLRFQNFWVYYFFLQERLSGMKYVKKEYGGKEVRFISALIQEIVSKFHFFHLFTPTLV